MVKIYGKEVKRNIKFDDRCEDLMMDLKLPTSDTWHNITIAQAREAKKIRDQLDLQNLRQNALTGSATGPDREKARALMLSISPTSNRTNTSGGISSAAGVVHINSHHDWSNLEGSRSNHNDTDNSIEEILRASSRR